MKGMTVGELIEHLSKFAPTLPVVVRGYEGGVNDVVGVNEVQVYLNAHSAEYYYGSHEIKWSPEHELPDYPLVDAIYIEGEERAYKLQQCLTDSESE